MEYEKLAKAVHELFDGLEKSQEQRVWKVANRINPRLILDDILNPQDHPDLVANPSFNYEDGQLAGLRAARIALNFSMREWAEKEIDSPNFTRSRRPSRQSQMTEPWGWSISESSADAVWGEIEKRLSQSNVTNPAVVFDLDGTLFDVGHRTLGILREWIARDAHQVTIELLERLRTIDFEHVGYSLAHAFENAGLDLRDQKTVDAFTLAERYWKKRFFDGASLVEYDRPVEGAAEFASRCALRGLKIIYLTGRHDTVMRAGTVEQLKQNNFPTDGARFCLKPDSNMEDLHFKERAFAELATQHTIVANFENEYVNIASMVLSDPNACHVIVDTQHSGRPAPPLKFPILRLRSLKL